MARALWKGSISFGLVSIPVGLVTVTEAESLDLDMIDDRDHSRIKYKKVNATTGKEVPHQRHPGHRTPGLRRRGPRPRRPRRGSGGFG